TGTNANTRYGITGFANGANGIGVQGTGARSGVYSNGPLGVAAGRNLACTGCVGAGALSSDARCGGYPHVGVDWSGRCKRNVANLSGAVMTSGSMARVILANANLSGARMDLATLTGANLYQANLHIANLTSAVLANAALTSAVLTGANLTSATLFGADLTG